MPLAHLGHYYSLIYAAPVILLLAWMGISWACDRRARRRAGERRRDGSGGTSTSDAGLGDD